jgi:hypothetical protein
MKLELVLCVDIISVRYNNSMCQFKNIYALKLSQQQYTMESS